MSTRAEPEAIWVDDDAALAEVCARLADQPRVALDTEFHGERSYYPQLALVQLAWPDGLALVDPFQVDLAPLGALLATGPVLVAHAGDQDLAILEHATGMSPHDYFDTQLAAGFCGFGMPALVNLVERLLGVRLGKGDRLTDWTRRPLHADQRSYAASDVAHLLEVTDLLHAELARRGRTDWAIAECRERLARDRSRPDPNTAWWKIKGSRQFRGATRGVAQCVAAWREQRAAALDQPTRFILSDLAIAAIIARIPTTVDDLRAIRGIDGRLLKDPLASELIAAVARGRELTADELVAPPRDDTDRTLGPAVAVVSAWLSQRANELGLESSLLATRADLTDLLHTGNGRLARDWRAELVGEPIARLVAGDAVIALRNGGRSIELRDANERDTTRGDDA